MVRIWCGDDDDDDYNREDNDGNVFCHEDEDDGVDNDHNDDVDYDGSDDWQRLKFPTIFPAYLNCFFL